MSSEQFTIVQDTREKRPFDFDSWPVEIATLSTGDYSIQGLEANVAIERKSLSDLCQCVSYERYCFVRELERMRGYRCRVVIIEATLQEILEGRYRSRVAPTAIEGSIASWTAAYGVPFIFAGPQGARFALAIMRQTWKQYQRLAEVLK